MEDLISKVLDFGMGNVIDKSRDPLLVQDEIYKQDCKDLSELDDRYKELDLTAEQRMIIDDYMACLSSANCRACDVTYMAGIRDAILFLNQVGLLKNNQEDVA